MQTLTQAYRKSLSESAKGKELSKAQKAVARWAFVDDYQALLDLSCTDTRLLHYFSDRYTVRTCGLRDLSHQEYRNYGDAGEAEIMHGNLFDIPWRDHSFHTAFLTTPWECRGNHQDMLSEIRRVIRPDGQLLIALPILSLFSPLSKKERNESPRLMFGVSKYRELLDILKTFGFHDSSIRFSSIGYATVVARRNA